MYTYEWNLPTINKLNNTFNEIEQSMKVFCYLFMYVTLPR